MDFALHKAFEAFGIFKGVAFIADASAHDLSPLLARGGWTGTIIHPGRSRTPDFKVVHAIPSPHDEFIEADGVFYPTCSIRTAVAKVGGGAHLLIAGSVDIMRSALWEAWSPKVVILRHEGRWEEANNFLFGEKGYRTVSLEDDYLVMVREGAP